MAKLLLCCCGDVMPLLWAWELVRTALAAEAMSGAGRVAVVARGADGRTGALLREMEARPVHAHVRPLIRI